MSHIGIKGLDRGGTNLLLGMFHCHPEFFSLSEKACGDLATMPISRVRLGEYNHYSMFRGRDFIGDQIIEIDRVARMRHNQPHSLKDVSTVHHIIFKVPRTTHVTRHLDAPEYVAAPLYDVKYEFHSTTQDKTIYLVRNPFRVYLSWMKVSPSHLPRVQLKTVVSLTLDLIREFQEDPGNEISKKLISHEYFLKNFLQELPALYKWCANDFLRESLSSSRFIADRFSGRRFMNPDLSESDIRNEDGSFFMIGGHGGFNLAHPWNYSYAVSAKLFDFWPQTFSTGTPSAKNTVEPLPTSAPERQQTAEERYEELQAVREQLGESLFDYWYRDVEHDYSDNLEQYLSTK